jgi:two-component system, chemotaxis family, CheB/CheR fusion protein
VRLRAKLTAKMAKDNVEDIGRSLGVLPPDKPQAGAHPAACPVVGVGASAGGLEAFQTFLQGVAPDSGLAYVLVQHLDPNHESMLAELLGRRTTLPVRQIADGVAVEPNTVYLIPPNASLTMHGARLRLSEFTEPRGFRRPIDVFFRSLAEDQGANAACVILSGTGADGSDGLRAVKEAGGLAIAQDPDTAKYDGMPRSAVATGLVDNVLPAKDMPGALRDYFERSQSLALALPDDGDLLAKVCEELRLRVGHDFSQYKRSTMLRRVQRRMQVVGAVAGEDYLDRLRTSPHEADLLFRDLLINVTCFFRDTEAFDFLRREVIPALLSGKGASDTVRIWSAGCSSGEEAYSIAILIAEALSRQRARPAVQIFATDIDEPMLQRARAGTYTHAAVKDVPIELLDRYFYAADGDEYVLAHSIRDMVRVSNHNLLKDPPFARVDMIVCRNLLIYLNSALQQRLMPVFHYALRPNGWLFLGSAENISNRSDLFETVEAGARIYRRKGVQRFSAPMPVVGDRPARGSIERQPARSELAGELDGVSRRILERYAPAHVVVNSENIVVRASSRTARFLELPAGAPSNSVSDLARRGLRPAIRAVLQSVRASGRRAVQRDVPVERDEGGLGFVDLTADPLDDDEVLLVFQDSGEPRPDSDADIDADVALYADDDRVRQLEEELEETRHRLRTAVEELETSNEELKSSNEEMMSMNEELQSANEELATVNEELNNKVDQLARANSDLQNFIESTQVPTVFLDRQLQIRSFTPATRPLFRFQEQDKGRAFSDVATRFDQARIEALGRAVLDGGEPVEEELQLPAGESFVVRALPYRDMNGVVTGVVLVFNDVTKIRETQADLAKNVVIARQRNDEIVQLYETAPVGMALVDRNHRFVKANKRFGDLVGVEVDALPGRLIIDEAPLLEARMRGPVAEVLQRGREVVNIEASLRLTSDQTQDLLIDFFPYWENGSINAVGVILKDVTEVRQLEKELRRLMDELQHRVKNTLATVIAIVNQTVRTRANSDDFVQTLKSRIAALAATHDMLTREDWRSVSMQALVEAELSPFDGHRNRISVRGPMVMLPPKHALTLTLTLHELVTNAAKYGAIASPNGRLDISWGINVDRHERRVTLTWEERGVDIEKHAAAKDSFGLRLVRSAVSHDLGGSCEHMLADGGVRCTISFTL